MNILQDIKTAAAVYGAVREARKAGADRVRIEPVYKVPCFILAPAYLNTMEGCLTWELGRDADQAVKMVFNALPHETQRRLEYTPEAPGEWVDRARFWQQELKPALSPKTYHAVMALFCNWYARCRRRRLGTQA